MGDWIGLGIILLVVIGALVGMSYLGRRPKRMTVEEYEEKVAEAKGTTRGAAVAGLYAMQKLLNPKAVEAIEVQRDLESGYYNDAEKKGDGGGVDIPPSDEAALKPKKSEDKEEDEEGNDA